MYEILRNNSAAYNRNVLTELTLPDHILIKQVHTQEDNDAFASDWH